MAEKLIHVEPLNGGLVTSRDPSLLEPGELTRADEACYLPSSQSLHKAPSQTAFNASPLTGAVSGLAYCAFDFVRVQCYINNASTTITSVGTGNFNGITVGARIFHRAFASNATVSGVTTNQITASSNAGETVTDDVLFDADNVLIAQNNNTFKIATAGTTGAFAALETSVDGDQLNAVHYGNQHVLMNGAQDNRVLKANRSTIPHGMYPVTVACSASVTTSGVWGLPTGFYSYWTTEYDKINDIESTYVASSAERTNVDGSKSTGSKPVAVNVDTVSKRVIITQPELVNRSATHWRVYRSVKMDATSQEAADRENVFPNGVLIGTNEIKTDGSQGTMIDGGGVTSTSPASADAVVQVGVGSTGATWADPTKIHGAGNTVFTSAAPSTNIFRPSAASLIVSFPTITPTAPITGIVVVVTAKGSAATKLWVDLKNSNGFVTNQKAVPLTTSLTAHTLGSADDNWHPDPAFAWTPEDFNGGTFQLRFVANAPVAGQTVEIDTVTVSVTHGKTQQLGDTVPFPFITVSPFGIPTLVGRNGKPPRASVGDIFQDSLVTDDVTDESIMRYSYPGGIHYFPSVYYLNFEGPDQDRLMNIRTVGNVLVVGLSSCLARVNYLPRAEDAEFDRGRAFEFYEKNHGIASRRGATVFSFVDGMQMLAYVSRSNLHKTDGYRTSLLTPDINFEKLVLKSQLSRSLLVNNPELYELQFYYVPLGSGTPTIPTKMIRLSYHPDHLKRGFMKVAGPVSVDVKSVALAVLRDGSRPLYTGNSTGTVNLENQGAVSTMTFRTRQMLLGGINRDWNLEDAYVHHTLYDFHATSPFNVTVTPRIDNVEADVRVGTGRTFAVAAYPSDGSAYPERTRLSVVSPHEAGRAISLETAFGSATHKASADYIVIRGEQLADKVL